VEFNSLVLGYTQKKKNILKIEFQCIFNFCALVLFSFSFLISKFDLFFNTIIIVKMAKEKFLICFLKSFDLLWP